MALGSRKLIENEACLPGTVVSAPWSAPLSEHDEKIFWWLHDFSLCVGENMDERKCHSN